MGFWSLASTEEAEDIVRGAIGRDHQGMACHQIFSRTPMCNLTSDFVGDLRTEKPKSCGRCMYHVVLSYIDVVMLNTV